MARGRLLCFSTKTMLRKVVSLAADVASQGIGFQELEGLAEMFDLAHKLLDAAEKERSGSGGMTEQPLLEIWLKKLHAVASNFDDVLDKFAFELHRRKLEIANRRNKVRHFFSLSNPLLFRHQMAQDLKKIKISLHEVCKIATEDLHLTPVDTDNSDESAETSRTLTVVDKSEIVGRSRELEEVVDQLLHSNNDTNLAVLAIVGMGGIGKTTLAQMVYNDVRVVNHVGEKMWLCVSDNFNVHRLLNMLLQCLGETKLSNLEEIKSKLKEKLQRKKYLLVLDDVWNHDVGRWMEMRTTLQEINSERGSKILVTTRSVEVARIMDAYLIFHLEVLTEEDSWCMFKNIAFATGGPIQTPTLEDLGRRMLMRCKGLPLAIKTMAGLMYLKRSADEWLSMGINEAWNSSEEQGIAGSLMLSFDQSLSPSVKQCFAYCSLFPKDYYFEKNDIIQLWMAQGYLLPPPGSSLTMEDIGSHYFNILLQNYFLQDDQKDEYDNIISCRMHDLVHDLAIYVSGSDCQNVEEWEEHDTSLRPQHLSVISSNERGINIGKEIAEGLRTLCLPCSLPDHIFGDLKDLRTLLLSDSGIEWLPGSIGRLKRLRYLNVSGTSIKSLPDSICKLYNLLTLKILRCQELKELPKEFQKLVSLRHFYVDNTTLMPMGIGKLTSIQTLPFFVVKHDNQCGIEELGLLSNLKGELKIYDLQHVKNKGESQKAKLSRKQYLYRLIFNWNSRREDEINNDEDVLEGLQPHENLKGLTIENFAGEKFPSWMMMESAVSSLRSLVNIQFYKCNRCKQMPALGQLPCLEVVEIYGMSNIERIGDEFYGHVEQDGVFPSLRTLILRDMPNLVEWLEVKQPQAVTVFPCLKELKIKGCDKLTTAPPHFPSIRELWFDSRNSSLALKEMSSTVTTLEDLYISGASGPDSELNEVLEQMLVKNKDLKQLRIHFCKGLSYLPNGLENLESLLKISLLWCPNLTCLPHGLHLPMSLERLEIRGCPDLAVANTNPHNLISLRDLELRHFETLATSWTKVLACLTALTRLEIGFFSEDLGYFPWPTAEEKEGENVTQHHLHCPLVSLESLSLWGWEKVKSLPEQLQHLRALNKLELNNFHGLQSLPEWLGNLSLLESLKISCAWKLKNLPIAETLHRTKLRSLVMKHCPLLKERYNNGTNTKTNKIGEITITFLDEEV